MIPLQAEARSNNPASSTRKECEKDTTRKQEKKWRTLLLVIYLCVACAVFLAICNRVLEDGGDSKYLVEEQRHAYSKKRSRQHRVELDGRQIMADAGFASKPEIIRYNGVLDPVSGETTTVVVDAIDTDTMSEINSRYYKKSKRNDKLWREAAKLDDDDDDRRGVFAERYMESRLYKNNKCEPQHDWQTQSFPTCNSFHEQDMKRLLSEHTNGERGTERARLSHVNKGAFRDVWRVFGAPFAESVALKTLVWKKDFDERNDERHKIDALANERLTFSRFIVPIYGFCGNSALVEYADGGMMQDILAEWRFNSTEKLILGYQAAAAVSDVHNTDNNGRASIAHTDVKPKQYVYAPEEGVMKLTDFNRCRFIEWNKKSKQTCSFRVGGARGKYRSPEEYDKESLTEKVDVFQVGNVLYTILTGKWPFEDYKQSTTTRYVTEGRFPPIADKFLTSTNTAEMALLEAMKMSWVHEPEKRASSMEIKNYLYHELQQLGVGDRVYFNPNQ